MVPQVFDEFYADGHENAAFFRSDSGYVTDETYLEIAHWLVSLPKFEEFRKKGAWQLLVLDGYGSHTMMREALQLFYDNMILVVALPPHTSSELQPLDVACFRVLKLLFGEKLRELHRELYFNLVDHIPRYNFWYTTMALTIVYDLALSKENILSGFRATGISPFNINWVEENSAKMKGDKLIRVNKSAADLPVLPASMTSTSASTSTSTSTSTSSSHPGASLRPKVGYIVNSIKRLAALKELESSKAEKKAAKEKSAIARRKQIESEKPVL